MLIINKDEWRRCHISGEYIAPGEGGLGRICKLDSDPTQKRNIVVLRKYLYEAQPGKLYFKQEYKDVALKAVREILIEAGHDPSLAEEKLEPHMLPKTIVITGNDDWIGELQSKKGSSETWKMVCNEVREAVECGNKELSLKQMTQKLSAGVDNLELLKSRLSTVFGIMGVLQLTDNTSGKYTIKPHARTFISLPEEVRVRLYKEVHHAAKRPLGWNGELTPSGEVPMWCRLQASKKLQKLMTECGLPYVLDQKTKKASQPVKQAAKISKGERKAPETPKTDAERLQTGIEAGAKKVTLPDGTQYDF